MSQDLLKNMYVLIPKQVEQKEIIDYLDEKIPSINKVIVQKKQLLTELKNYKKSLVFEYVTGKKEVPVA